MELPAIMQWLKQTFAQRYNALTGRTGHIWGDRYWSLILEGEPVEDAEAALDAGNGDSPHRRESRRNPRFPLVFPAPHAPTPGEGAGYRPPTSRIPTPPRRISIPRREDPP
jgi:hypothetical protein